VRRKLAIPIRKQKML